MNTTTRIAVEIKKLPDYDFDWNDHTPVQSLTEEDILPSENDGVIRMVTYVKKFLIAKLDPLKHLRSRNHSLYVRKSVVIPMKLFHDENYTDENNDFMPVDA